jgi:ABC-2 type transport system ATP-binding protein
MSNAEPQNAISIRDLRKTYDNGHVALNGINLDVRENDFFALLGPNGAGKSTIIGIISTLVKATGGQIQIFGKDVASHVYETKLSLGVVPQEINFSQFEKVGDIVMTQAGYYGLKGSIARERTEKYLKKLDLWEKRDDRSRMLSGGMKRQVDDSARAWCMNLRLADPGRAYCRRGHRTTPLNVGVSAGNQPQWHHHCLDDPLPGGGGESVPEHCHHRQRIAIVENTSMRALLGKLAIQTLVFDTCDEIVGCAASLRTRTFPACLIDSHSFEVTHEYQPRYQHACSRCSTGRAY